uniref:CCHC-type domain-containing protein n=1 Tax=Glossina pallidipes TaxID=7398 RepID=A0A1A9ZY71_GLOPL
MLPKINTAAMTQRKLYAQLYVNTQPARHINAICMASSTVSWYKPTANSKASADDRSILGRWLILEIILVTEENEIVTIIPTTVTRIRATQNAEGSRGNRFDKKFEKFMDIQHRDRERDYQMNWHYNNNVPQNHVFFNQETMHSNDTMTRNEQRTEIEQKEVARVPLSPPKKEGKRGIDLVDTMNAPTLEPRCLEGSAVANIKTENSNLSLNMQEEQPQIKVESRSETSSSSSSSSNSSSEEDQFSKSQIKPPSSTLKSEDFKGKDKSNDLKLCNKVPSSSSSDEKLSTSSLKKSRIPKKQEISEPKLKSKSSFPRGQSDDDIVCMGHLNNQIDLDDEEDSERKTPSKKCKKSKKDSPCSEQCKLCDKEGHTSFQCQMICKNCSTPYHGFRTCPQLPNLNTMLHLFMEFCMQQLQHFQPNPEASLQQLQHLLNNEAPTVPIPLVSKPAMYENSSNKRKLKKFAAKQEQTAKKLKTMLKTGTIRNDERAIDASSTCSSSSSESSMSEATSKLSRKHTKALRNEIRCLNFPNFLSTPANCSNLLNNMPNFPVSSSSSSSAYNSMSLTVD